MRSYAFVVGLFLSQAIFAGANPLCGRYTASAKVIDEKGKIGLLLNEGSHNSIILEVEDAKLISDKVGGVLDVTFFIDRFCTRRCKAEIVKVENVSSPFKAPKAFQQNEANRETDPRCK